MNTSGVSLTLWLGSKLTFLHQVKLCSPDYSLHTISLYSHWGC